MQILSCIFQSVRQSVLRSVPLFSHVPIFSYLLLVEDIIWFLVKHHVVILEFFNVGLENTIRQGTYKMVLMKTSNESQAMPPDGGCTTSASPAKHETTKVSFKSL